VLEPGSQTWANPHGEPMPCPECEGRFDVPAVRAHCELILALGRRHRDPDALAVLADWREETGGTLPVTAFPGRPRGGHDLAFTRPARRLLDTLGGRCPWAPSAGAQPDACGCLTEHETIETATAKAMDARGAWLRSARRAGDTPPPRIIAGHPRAMALLSATRAHDDYFGDRSHLDMLRQRLLGKVDFAVGPCPDCQGTGRNLSGYLPPVEDAPQSKWAKAFWVRETPHRQHSDLRTLDRG